MTNLAIDTLKKHPEQLKNQPEYKLDLIRHSVKENLIAKAMLKAKKQNRPQQLTAKEKKQLQLLEILYDFDEYKYGDEWYKNLYKMYESISFS